jgi:hypothetical protein
MATLLSLVTYFYVSRNGNSPYIDGKYNFYFSIALMLAMILCMFCGNNMAKRKIKKLKAEDLVKKLVNYKEIYQKRIRWFSIISVIAVFGMIVGADKSYAIFSAISIILIVLSRCSKLKVKYELNLSEEDIKKMENMKFN